LLYHVYFQYIWYCIAKYEIFELPYLLKGHRIIKINKQFGDGCFFAFKEWNDVEVYTELIEIQKRKIYMYTSKTKKLTNFWDFVYLFDNIFEQNNEPIKIFT